MGLAARPPESSCRVCGAPQDDPSWSEHGPSYDICDCCGCQFGVDDMTLSIVHEYREAWLRDGAPWWYAPARPPTWSPEDVARQMSHIDPRFVRPVAWWRKLLKL